MRLLYITIIALIITLPTACSKDAAADASASSGTGGSLARFTIAANHLYLVDYSTIEIYDLKDPASPVKKTPVNVGWGIETIYPYQVKLFVGSSTGMFIYSIANPSSPVKLGEALHVRSCDPVVANDKTAYVTLRGSGRCGAAVDGLYIYDVSNILKPVQQSLLPLSNANGLGLKDSVVFVCRANDGLSLVNVKNPSSPKLMYTITGGDNFIDVISYDNLLICYVGKGLMVYDISNLNQITKVSTINY